MKDSGHPRESEIEMAFKCGNCKNKHVSAADGRACYAGKFAPFIAPCSWLVQDYGEDGPCVRECGADATVTERGFTCTAGHSHVDAEYREREGWDYAHDPQEARQLMKAGVFPMTMDGTGPSEIAPY